jgi:hypothetical protein
MGKPVLLLLNQAGPPRSREAEAADEARGRKRSQRTCARAAIITLDAFARCWVQEDRLLRRGAALLAGTSAARWTPGARHGARATSRYSDPRCASLAENRRGSRGSRGGCRRSRRRRLAAAREGAASAPRWRGARADPALEAPWRAHAAAATSGARRDTTA